MAAAKAVLQLYTNLLIITFNFAFSSAIFVKYGSMQECIDCTKLNRHNSTLKCPRTSFDCGDCFSGFFPYIKLYDFCTSNDMTEHLQFRSKPPTKIVGREGSFIQLFCEFNIPVTVQWTHNGRAVNGGMPEYHWMWCMASYVEFQLSTKDVGEWQCVGRNDYGQVISASTTVSIKDHTPINDDVNSRQLFPSTMTLLTNYLKRIYPPPLLTYPYYETINNNKPNYYRKQMNNRTNFESEKQSHFGRGIWITNTVAIVVGTVFVVAIIAIYRYYKQRSRRLKSKDGQIITYQSLVNQDDDNFASEDVNLDLHQETDLPLLHSKI